MFSRNRALQVKMVKTPKNEKLADTNQECTHADPEKIAEIAKDFVTHTAKAVGVVIVSAIVLSALGRIADNKTKSNDD